MKRLRRYFHRGALTDAVQQTVERRKLQGRILIRRMRNWDIDSRNLFVPDFARSFLLIILDVERTLIKFACSRRKIGRKGRRKGDSERLWIKQEGGK